MKAVLRHELSSAFTSVSGYVFGAFLLLFAGIYTMVINLSNGYASFEYVFSNMSFIFLIIVPVATMRVISEERRQRTDQLLYSLPLSMTQVVFGKYLALLVTFLLPLAVIAIYPLVLMAFGSIYLPAVFGSLIAFFLLGAALLAVGMFISSLTESQAAAAGLCFVVILLNYFLSSLSSYVSSTSAGTLICLLVFAVLLGFLFRFMTGNTAGAGIFTLILLAASFIGYVAFPDALTGLIPDVCDSLSLFERFYTFIDGVFDVTGVVFFLTVIGVFLFLTVQSMEKRRWS